jgi:hypothetical protein
MYVRGTSCHSRVVIRKDSLADSRGYRCPCPSGGHRTAPTPENETRANTKSVWLGKKHTIPALITRGGCSIVNTGSYLA